MSDRKTASTITDAELDALHARVARAERAARRAQGSEAWMAKHLARQDSRVHGLTRDRDRWRQRAERAEAERDGAYREPNEATASQCFLMAHEKRLHEDRHAWVALARIRDVIADMENITGARHWARILRKVVDGEEPAPGPDTAATQATEQPPLAIPHDMATTLHRTLGQLLGDQDAHAIARVRALHVEDYGSCRECTHSHSVAWPCPTITALDQPKEPTP